MKLHYLKRIRGINEIIQENGYKTEFFVINKCYRAPWQWKRSNTVAAVSAEAPAPAPHCPLEEAPILGW